MLIRRSQQTNYKDAQKYIVPFITDYTEIRQITQLSETTAAHNQGLYSKQKGNLIVKGVCIVNLCIHTYVRINAAFIMIRQFLIRKTLHFHSMWLNKIFCCLQALVYFLCVIFLQCKHHELKSILCMCRMQKKRGL